MELGSPTGSLDSGTDTGKQGTTQQTQQKVITPHINPGIFSDHKFNLFIQGVPECSSDMKRLENLQSDLSSVLKELSSLNSSLTPDCVKDTFRLGKYKSNSNRPRPILVKFLRSGDVQSILSNRKLLKSKISIKPNMTPEERNNEKILLAEHWSLLQREVNREIIKIRGNIFVNNKIHGKVKQGQFCLSNIPTSDSTQPSTNTLTPTSDL